MVESLVCLLSCKFIGFSIMSLLAFNIRKVVLSGQEKRPRDLVFLLSCKVTEEAGSGAGSFVLVFLFSIYLVFL